MVNNGKGKQLDEVGKILEFKEEVPMSNRTFYGNLYHYRTLEGFWSIIDSDAFWATNARFSNDKEEQNMGMEHFKNLLSQKKRVDELFTDSYIVCFCKEDDKLSQWRGYAPNGGVSIGFDFTNTRPFSIVGKDGTHKILYTTCYDVKYINQDSDILDLYYDLQSDSETDVDSHIIHSAFTLVPYIKHKGFEEENEYRLVFTNLDNRLAKFVRYRGGNVKISYVVATCGNLEKKSERPYVRLCIHDSADVKDAVTGLLSKATVDYIDCTSEDISIANDISCHGCTMRRVNRSDVESSGDSKNSEIKCLYSLNRVNSEGKKDADPLRLPSNDAIIVSEGNEKQQEDICGKIRALFSELAENDPSKKTHSYPPVWCEGHLPIRSLTVSPMPNIDEVTESLEHYCKNIYWLADVKIRKSKIPYRSEI